MAFDRATWPEPRVGEGPVVMVHAPAQHFLRIFEHESMVGGIAGEVVKFVGVFLQIEKKRWQGGKMDVFIPLVPD